MIGRATLFWILLTGIVGFGLFHVKHKVQGLEEEIARLNGAIVQEQEQIHVLRAEWAHLNQPQRLEELSAHYLELGPMKPIQLSGISALPPRAPADSADGKAVTPTAERR